MSTHHGTVQSTEQLSPSMIRVVLGGAGLDAFEPTPFTDEYVNALFIPDGAPYGAPFDADAVGHFPPEHRPRGRRYTIRSWDAATRELTIDFVVHGDVGFAGRWAQQARPGDLLQIVGPTGAYAPDPESSMAAGMSVTRCRRTLTRSRAHQFGWSVIARIGHRE